MTDLKKRGRPAKAQEEVVEQAEGRDRPSQSAAPAEVERAEQSRGTRERQRISMAKNRRLDYKIKDGFRAYWFKNTPGRIEQAKKAWYEHVIDAQGSPVKVQSGANELYLMQIPEQYYQEDFESGQKKVNDVTRSKLEGAMTIGKDDYVPDGQRAPLSRDKDLPV